MGPVGGRVSLMMPRHTIGLCTVFQRNMSFCDAKMQSSDAVAGYSSVAVDVSLVVVVSSCPNYVCKRKKRKNVGAVAFACTGSARFVAGGGTAGMRWGLARDPTCTI